MIHARYTKQRGLALIEGAVGFLEGEPTATEVRSQFLMGNLFVLSGNSSSEFFYMERSATEEDVEKVVAALQAKTLAGGSCVPGCGITMGAHAANCTTRGTESQRNPFG